MIVVDVIVSTIMMMMIVSVSVIEKVRTCACNVIWNLNLSCVHILKNCFVHYT